MWITSSFKGEVVGEKRSITVPSRSIRNLAKFHLMLSRRAPNMPPFDCLRYLYKGAWFGPFTSICNSFATGFSSITKLAKLLRSYCQLSILLKTLSWSQELRELILWILDSTRHFNLQLGRAL